MSALTVGLACIAVGLETKVLPRIALAGSLVAFVGIGWVLGREASSAAYNECVDGAATIQGAIDARRTPEGAFPPSLADVFPAGIPCDRPFRGTLLIYEPTTESSYRLSFGDWLVSWSGDQETPLSPHK